MGAISGLARGIIGSGEVMGKPEKQSYTADWSIDETLKTLKTIEEALKTDRGTAQPGNALTPRERLIQRAFEMSNTEIEAVLDYIDNLEDLEDAAIIESRRDEVGIPLDDALKQLGFTREELMEEIGAEDTAQ
jgi:hypothetical protein